MKKLKYYIYFLSFFMTINFTTPVFAAFCQIEHGLKTSQITSLFAVFSLSVFFLEIPTGVISDRIGEKKSLLIGAILTAIAMLLFINGAYALLYAGELIFGLASTFFSGPFDSMVYKYCKMSNGELEFDDIASKSYSLQWFALCFSFLGCFIITKLSLVYVFYATFVANIILLIIVVLLPRVDEKIVENSSVSAIIKGYIDEFLSNRKMSLVCLLNVFFSMILVTGYLILQTYLLNSSLSEKYNGLLYFAAALFAGSGSFFYCKLKELSKSIKVLICICLILISLCMFGLGLSCVATFIFIFVCLYRLVWGITSPMFSSLVNQSIKDDSFRNTAFSVISLGSNLGSSLLLFLFSLTDMRAMSEYRMLGILCVALLCICLFGKKIYTNIDCQNE